MGRPSALTGSPAVAPGGALIVGQVVGGNFTPGGRECSVPLLPCLWTIRREGVSVAITIVEYSRRTPTRRTEIPLVFFAPMALSIARPAMRAMRRPMKKMPRLKDGITGLSGVFHTGARGTWRLMMDLAGRSKAYQTVHAATCLV